MQIDWLSMITGQQGIAHNLGSAVMDQLANPNLTEREIANLQSQVELGSTAYNALLKALGPRVIDEAFFFTTAALSQFWVDLSRTVEERQRQIASRKLNKSRRNH